MNYSDDYLLDNLDFNEIIAKIYDYLLNKSGFQLDNS